MEKLRPGLLEEGLSSANDRIERARKQARETNVSVLCECQTMEAADVSVKHEYLSQLESLAKASLIVFGRHTSREANSDIAALCLELLSKTEPEGGGITDANID